MVVTRFRSADPERKHGAGWLHEGWHYELLAMNLPADAWPAAWVASLYFGRAVIENRFGQEIHELDLKTVMSYSEPGQLLATAVGLYVWNRRVCLGAALAKVPARTQDAAAAPAALAAESALSPIPEPPSEPPQPPPTADVSPAALLSQPWSAALDHKPGWTQVSEGVQCPAGETLRLRPGKTKVTTVGAVAITLRASRTACVNCSHRAQCTQSKSPSFRKELMLVLANRVSQDGTPMGPVWTPPPPAPNPHMPETPVVVPSEFRKTWLAVVRQVQALVVLARMTAPLQPSWLASTRAQRQHRRQSWQQRRERALADPRHVVELRNVGPLRQVFASIAGESTVKALK